MLIIDSHLDLAWNALQWNRDLRQSVYTIRAQERGLKVTQPGNGLAMGTVALPELRQGRFALGFATLLARCTGRMAPHIDYLSPEQTYASAQGQLAYYRALARTGQVRLITDLAGLDSHMAEWMAWDALAQPDPDQAPPLGFVIAMESADPILDPDQLTEFWQAGVRIIGPAHYGPGRYAGGTGTEEGLTDLGTALLREMDRLGIILDLTHCSDRAFWQALDQFGGPILASHNNCRVLVPNQRQFSDEQLRAIIGRSGVIGVMCDVAMLQFGWTVTPGVVSNVPLAKILDHIDHICQLAGNARHVAIGSDLDGGYGREQSPADLDTIADLQKLVGMLADRGYAQADIAAILHGNWLALLRRAWVNGMRP